jgi:FixJ family two-component response regulator
MSADPPISLSAAEPPSPGAGLEQPIVLIVDDDAAVARLLEETLSPTFRARSVTKAREALDIIAHEDVAVVLADQRMPVMDGLELLSEARRLKPTVVGVLITAHADVESAIHAINSARVLGFLSKPWDEQELMLVLQRAIEAHVALRQLSRVSQQSERELRRFEAFSGGAPAPVTALRYGAVPIRQSVPDEFHILVGRYADLLGLALEQRAYKVDHHIGQGLHTLADRLGGLNAGPRDVVDVHVAAHKQRLEQTSYEEGSALIEEGRLLVLELMGHVVTYYRTYALGVRT